LAKKYPLVIVPGGGEFADTVRKLDKQFALSNVASHKMAILAMDQYGLLLADLLPSSRTVKSIDELRKTIAQGVLSILLPSELMLLEDPLANSWDVTSDSIAFYFAHRLQAEKVLFVTDVDGIYNKDPKQVKDAKLINKISAMELSLLPNPTSVDKALPKLIIKWPIDCYVINGLYPQRIESILKSEKTPSTLITYNEP
jgi:aspartokinase-like uncharacterized kinase